MSSLLGGSNEHVRIYRATEILDLPWPADPYWIGPSILPKSGFLLFGGPAKIGKSMIMLNLGRDLALGVHRPLGCPFFECPAPVKVLAIEQELKLLGTKARLEDLFRDCPTGERELLRENFHLITGEPRMQLSTEDGRAEILHAVKTVKPGVLVLDPIGKMMAGWDENRADQMSMLFLELAKLIKVGEDWGMSLIVSHHFGKPPRNSEGREGYDALEPYNFRGSSKFVDDPDTLVTVERRGVISKPWKAWNIHTRWETRRGEPPPGDLRFSVNRDDDLRVRYEGMVGAEARLTPELPGPDLRKKEKMPEAPAKDTSKLLTFPKPPPRG